MTAITAPDEEGPHRSVKSKRFIDKIMFLAAVARPVFAADGSVLFDGKIGFWPFVKNVAAKYSTRNRPKGVLELKPVNVDKVTYRELLVENVLPAVRNHWPKRRTGTIYIQQDNASPHVPGTDEAIVENGQRYGWDIRLVNQPPNSPDFNVLDLGLFRAMQSATQDHEMKNNREIVEYATKAFEEMTASSLNDSFLSLQKHMESAMLKEGGNNFKEPHVKKVKRRRAGEDIEVFKCSDEAYSTATVKLEQS